MDILLMDIGVFNGYYNNVYWLLVDICVYSWLLVDIWLLHINGYCTSGYWRLFY
jgi:hypothetical protein